MALGWGRPKQQDQPTAQCMAESSPRVCIAHSVSALSSLAWTFFNLHTFGAPVALALHGAIPRIGSLRMPCGRAQMTELCTFDPTANLGLEDVNSLVKKFKGPFHATPACSGCAPSSTMNWFLRPLKVGASQRRGNASRSLLA